MLHDSCKIKIDTTFLLVESPCLNSSMARTKVTPRKGEKGGTESIENMSRSACMEEKSEGALITCAPPISSTTNPSGSQRNNEKKSGGGVARGDGEVDHHHF